MRILYRERRSALVDSMRTELDAPLEILGAEEGMHLAALLPPGISDLDTAQRAARLKLWLWPLSPSYLGEARPGFILGFGSTPAEEMPRAVRKLRSALNPT